MNPIGWILLLSLIASVGVIAAVALFIIYGMKRLGDGSWLLSFAVGTLLASAFLGMLPAALSRGNELGVCATVLAGMLIFFGLEKSLLWRHSHGPNRAEHSPAGAIIICGDAFHNFVDGVVIAVACLSSIPMGIAITLAVVAHEIPQEAGDLAILLHSGYGMRRAFLLDSLSALTTPIGAIAAMITFSRLEPFVPYALAFSAASFIYVGTADLIPGLQRELKPRNAVLQFGFVLMGVAVIAGLRTLVTSE